MRKKNKIVDWDPENLDQEKLFTQDTNYGSEIAFRVLNTQPIRSLRNLLNSVTSYEAPDPGRVRVTEIAENTIENDGLVDTNAVTFFSSSDDEWYRDREAVEDSTPPSKRRKINLKTLKLCV